MTPKQVDLHLNRAQLWLFLFWCGICSARVGGSSLSSSTGGRWCSWGSLINSSRAFISSLMDLVRAHQGFDYLPLAMQRDWLHVCVLVFVRKLCERFCACVCVIAEALVCPLHAVWYCMCGRVFTRPQRSLYKGLNLMVGGSEWRKGELFYVD